MSDSIYDPVLADLIRKRDRLNNTIELLTTFSKVTNGHTNGVAGKKVPRIARVVKKLVRAKNGGDARELDPKKAAAFLDITAGTLAVWRMKGKGPRFKKKANSNRITYTVADLEAFKASNGVREDAAETSTS